MDEENNCKRYSNGSCLDGDFVSKCVGKDCCGAYEPKVRLVSRFGDNYMRVDADNHIELQATIEPHISVAKLREILDKCVEVGYINEYSKHRILELVKGGYDD